MPTLKPLVRALLLSGLALSTCQAAPAAVPSSSYRAPLSAVPMNQIVQQHAMPQLDALFDKMSAEQGKITIDGVEAFKTNDKFLPGKIATGLTHSLLNLPKGDPRLAKRLAEFRTIADLTVDMDNQTWGVYYYLQAMLRLKKAGLLEQAISPAALAKLKVSLDWRRFVREPSYELINLPTNYYGVAFSVARLRMLLGWEDERAGQVLLEKMLTHYQTYSGKFGFSDETEGEGRFDRYSILLIAEICERFIETGLTVTPELKTLLRKAAVVALNMGNEAGEGFSFGRSLGPYGETAVLEILSVSAYLDVLTREEKEYAYAYANGIVAKYMDFWYDPAMGSVDMWGKGRRTDAYRGKHRILGENFSLLHQIIFTTEAWNKAGFGDAAPKAGLHTWLARTQPRFSMTRFAEGEHERALATVRDGRHVFSLPLINGGASQHANSPYYPLPFATGIISGTPDSGAAHAQLTPKFKLADGSELIGTAWMKDITTRRRGTKSNVVSFRQDELTRLGANAPIKDGRIAMTSSYTFAPGMITRVDTYTPAAPLQVARASLEFASFSDGATIAGKRVRFNEGDVTSFEVSGLDACTAAPTGGAEPFRAPAGAMRSHVSCASENFSFTKPLSITWTLRYR
jgi:hypothetical protein